MRLLPVAVTAFLCATIVYGAPSTKNPSFQDLASLSPFTQDYWVDVKCIYGVVNDVMEGSDVEGLWADAKLNLEKLIGVDWQKCLQIGDKAQQEKCKMTCIEEGVNVVTEFLTKLFSEHKLDLVLRIRTEITKKCFSDEVEQFTFASSLVELFQCMFDVLAQVSKDNGLEELWRGVESDLQQHLDSWAECANLKDPLTVFSCNVKEGIQTHKTVVAYFQAAAAQNPEFARQFLNDFQQQCGVPEDDLAFSIAKVDRSKNLEHLKCIFDAINAAMKETDFASVWGGYRLDINEALQRVKACKTQINKWEAAKCVSKEVFGSYEILNKFIDNMKKANYETYIRVKSFIKARCY